MKSKLVIATALAAILSSGALAAPPHEGGAGHAQQARKDDNRKAPAQTQARQGNRGKTQGQAQTQRRRKGERLDAKARNRYVVNDWKRRGLRQPPKGYHWVRERNGAGDFILVAIATGIIANVIAGR